MARLPVATIDAGLDAQFVTATVYYLSFNQTDPGTTGAGELSGITREPITFVAASGGTKISGGTDGAQTFTGVPASAGGLPYYSIWSTLTGGTYEGGGTTTGLSGAISVGATIQVAAGGTVWTGS